MGSTELAFLSLLRRFLFTTSGTESETFSFTSRATFSFFLGRPRLRFTGRFSTGAEFSIFSELKSSKKMQNK
ncbi:hypothetical protein MKX01_014207, partial [Papaver californicum]